MMIDLALRRSYGVKSNESLILSYLLSVAMCAVVYRIFYEDQLIIEFSGNGITIISLHALYGYESYKSQIIFLYLCFI